MLLSVKPSEKGALFNHSPAPSAYDTEPAFAKGPEAVHSGLDSLAFAGLLCFLFLLYVRPSELFPAAFGKVPFAKIAAILTVVSYFLSRLTQPKPMTTWPIELRSTLFIGFLGLALTPIAYSPEASAAVLSESYVKIICMFLILINVLDVRSRLKQVIWLVVICGTGHALVAIKRYAAGELALKGQRIAGAVGGDFADPNDLAVTFNLLLPLALALALTYRGVRRVFLLFCVVALAAGVVATASRGGLLGLVLSGGVLFWKLGRYHRQASLMITVLAGLVFLGAAPSAYKARLAGLSSGNDDSVQQRSALVKQGLSLAARRSLLGVGMGNFVEYTQEGKVAHNSYIEITAELGVAGLLAYLIILWVPLTRLRKIEKNAEHPNRKGKRSSPDSFGFYLSVGLQASFFSYALGTLFLSLQYSWLLYLMVSYTVALYQLETVPDSDAGEKPRGTIWLSVPAGRGGASFQTGGALWKQA